MDFGSDGALYVGSYSGGYYAFNNTNMGVWRFAYTGGPDTPGPDPKAIVPDDRRASCSSTSASPAASPTRGTSATARRRSRRRTPTVVAHLRLRRHQDGDADGQLRRRRHGHQDGHRRRRADAAVHQRQPGRRRHACRSCSSLTLGAPATFGAFTPVASTRTTRPRRRRRALATSGNAALTVADPSATTHRAPGQRRLHAALAAPGQGHERHRHRRRRVRRRRRHAPARRRC